MHGSDIYVRRSDLVRAWWCGTGIFSTWDYEEEP